MPVFHGNSQLWVDPTNNLRSIPFQGDVCIVQAWEHPYLPYYFMIHYIFFFHQTLLYIHSRNAVQFLTDYSLLKRTPCLTCRPCVSLPSNIPGVALNPVWSEACNFPKLDLWLLFFSQTCAKLPLMNLFLRCEGFAPLSHSLCIEVQRGVRALTQS